MSGAVREATGAEGSSPAMGFKYMYIIQNFNLKSYGIIKIHIKVEQLDNIKKK